MWFNKAALHGHEQAIEKVAELEQDLDSQELDAAGSFSEQWLDAPCLYSEVFPDN